MNILKLVTKGCKYGAKALRNFELEAIYLDYFNNFLTREGYADYYNANCVMVCVLINDGRTINHSKDISIR